jgi:hypothetical protein
MEPAGKTAWYKFGNIAYITVRYGEKNSVLNTYSHKLTRDRSLNLPDLNIARNHLKRRRRIAFASTGNMTVTAI